MLATSQQTLCLAKIPFGIRITLIGALVGFDRNPLAIAPGSRLLCLAKCHPLKPSAPIRSLAVLPFTCTKSGAEGASGQTGVDEVALLGMTDALIEHLEEELEVRPTSSVLRYSDSSDAGKIDVVAAGREQGVDAVLTGTIEQSDGHARLQMRLYRVRDGLVLWQDGFSSGSSSLAQLEQQAGQSVAQELHHLDAIAAPPTESATKTRMACIIPSISSSQSASG